MKKIVFTLAGSLLISLTAIQAQNDTTRTNTRTQQSTKMQQQGKQDRYRTDEMVVVKVDDIPMVVTETLKDPKFKGWEQRTVYLDPSTGDYIIEVEGMNGVPTQHRIDKNGKESADLDNQQNRNDQNQYSTQDQNDSQLNKDQQKDSQTQKQDQGQYPPSNSDNSMQQQSNQYVVAEELQVVEVNDVPVAVVEVLKDSKYKGWEKRAVYLDPVTEDYIVEVEKAGEMPHHYRVTRNDNSNQNRMDNNQGNIDQNRKSGQTYPQTTEDPNRYSKQSDANRQNKDDQNKYSTKDRTADQQSKDDQTKYSNRDRTTAQQKESQNKYSTKDRTASQQQKDQDKTSAQDRTKSQQHPSTQYRTEKMTVVRVNDVPVAVTQTLKDPKYKGWEKRTVYRDPATGDYIVEVERVSGGTPKQYRLDKTGKDISDHK